MSGRPDARPDSATGVGGPSAAGDRVLVVGAAALGLLLTELLRTWLPSLVVVLGERSGVGPIGLAGAALLTLAAGLVVAPLLGPVPPRVVWLLGGSVLLGARLALLLVDGGQPQFLVATVGMAGGSIALVGLAAGSVRGDLARLGVVSGAALSFAVLAVLGSVDLTWRDGAIGTLGTLTLVGLVAPQLARTTRVLDGGPTAAAWPWGTIGPSLVLLGIVAGPAGRVAVATDWSAGRVAVATVGLLGLAPLGGVVAARSGPLLSGTAGAVLVVIGTAAALAADSVAAVAGQGALAAGIGLTVVAGSRGGRTTARRRGVVAGASLLLFGALVFVVYAGALVRLPFGQHAVLLTGAALLAVGALVSTLRAARLGRETPSAALPRVTAATLVVVLTLVVPAGLRSPADAGDVREDGELRMVLANVHFGFDVDGRQRASEVGALLAELDADLVAVNEVDRGWLISGAPDLLSTYHLATGLTAVFGPASGEVWGNALLTRLPVLEVQRAFLPRGIDPQRRGVLTVVVEQADGRPLGVVVTHLSNVDRQGDTRLPQAQAVAAVVARLRERGIPAVVLGDLNAQPGDPELAVLEGLGLTGALPDARLTFPDRSPRVRLDHVLVPDVLSVDRADALATGLSDHRFVVVDARPAPVSEPSAP